MLINCPRCKNSYTVSDSLIPGKGTHMSCSKCQSSFITLPGGLTVLVDSENAGDFGLTPGSDLDAPAAQFLEEGDVLQVGRFEVKSVLGKGRYGSIHRVFDKHMEMELALKVLRVPEGRASDAFGYLTHEFKLCEKIKDRSHILGCYLPILEEYKGLSLVLLPMELADGGSLRSWMVEHNDLETRNEQALAYFEQTCLGVKAIHEVGLVHLDLKPENILIVKGEIKISDFGLSQDLENFGVNSMPLTWHRAGETHYMAPEQIMAARPKDVDQSADIYSLGCVLFELLDGDPPYVGTAYQIMEKHNRGIMPKLLGAQESLADTIWKCIEKDPSKRFSEVSELYDSLINKGAAKSSEDFEHDEKSAWLKTVCARFDMYQNAAKPEEKFFHNVQKWVPNALDLLHWGVETGSPEAQYRLGILYYFAEGLEEDKVEALRLWMLAAEQDLELAQYNVAMCLDYGQGVQEDKNQAAKWYLKAAEQGNADAQKDLGNCYFYGEGVPENKEEAVKWYYRSASKGNAAAQCNLGYCYHKGMGVSINKQEAEKWLRKSVEQGNQDASKLLNML